MAAESELAVGDVITHLDGVPIHSARHAVLVLRLVSRSVEFRILRKPPGSGRKSGSRSDIDLGPAYLTGMADGSETMTWNDAIEMKVSPRRGLLRIRLFDQKVKGPPNAPKSKPLLVGTADVDLDSVALDCALHPGKHTEQYPVRSSDVVASPIVGKITVAITHKNERVVDIGSGSADTYSLPAEFTFEERAGGQTDEKDAIYRRARANSDAIAPNAASTISPTGLDKASGVDLATQMQTIQSFIDLEEETRVDLERQLEQAVPRDRSRLKANIKLSDDRMKTLVDQMLKLEGALWGTSVESQ